MSSKIRGFLWALVALTAGFFYCQAQSAEDVTAPEIVAFSLAPTTVETSTAVQTVTVNLSITDDLSGFSRGTICLQQPSNGSQTFWTRFDANQCTGGTADNGSYSVTVQFPQYVQVGGWQLLYVELIDTVGNSRVIKRLDPAFGTYSTITTF